MMKRIALVLSLLLAVAAPARDIGDNLVVNRTTGICTQNVDFTGTVTFGATTYLQNILEDTTPQLGGFLDANGKYIGKDKGGDIASASPLVVGTDGGYFDVTGTTNFAAMTVATNRSFILQFDGILTITHGASLSLPGAANITTAAGDIATFQSTAANTVVCTSYTRADGTAVVCASATTTTEGCVELATTAEVTTGTDTTRAVTASTLPSQVQDSKWNFAADAAASDAYAITLSPAPAAYATGQTFNFTANTANTGASTLNVNGLGAKAIKKFHDKDTATGDIESGQAINVFYDGTNFQMLSHPATSSGTEYASIYETGGSTALTCTVQNTWYQVVSFSTNGLSSGVTPDHTNDHITIDATGNYRVEITVSFGGSGSSTFEVSAWKNNGATQLFPCVLERKLGTGGDVGAAPAMGDITLTATDTVEMWVRCTDGASKNFTPSNYVLTVTRL